LPDIIGQLQSRVAEFEVDAPEFLRLGHIDRALHHLPHGLLDSRSQLLHAGLDAFLSARRGRRGSAS
jgi:hypothetical protein